MTALKLPATMRILDPSSDGHSFLPMLQSLGMVNAMKLRIILLILLCLLFAPVAANAGALYKNGPVTGICDIQQCTVDAWTINFGFTVTDSMSFASAVTVQDLHFAFWLFPGDTMTSLGWDIGTNPN